DDKLNVQIAYQSEREGLRITWDYVTRRVNRTCTPNAFHLWLASLNQTYGNKLANFPCCFFLWPR
ncbi:hypothetical protein PHMEG_00013862, partial [Phytophthora megakarya]